MSPRSLSTRSTATGGTSDAYRPRRITREERRGERSALAAAHRQHRLRGAGVAASKLKGDGEFSNSGTGTTSRARTAGITVAAAMLRVLNEAAGGAHGSSPAIRIHSADLRIL